jgi:hypothetical protein
VIQLIYTIASRFVAVVAHQLWMMYPSSVLFNTLCHDCTQVVTKLVPCPPFPSPLFVAELISTTINSRPHSQKLDHHVTSPSLQVTVASISDLADLAKDAKSTQDVH